MNQLANCKGLFLGAQPALRRAGQIIVRIIAVAVTVITLSGEAVKAQYNDCSLTCSATVPDTGKAGVAVGVSASAYAVYCEGEATYTWTFGEGAGSTGQSATHTYNAPGTYSWGVTVSIGGASCTQSGTITITPRANVLACVSAASYATSGVATESIVAAFGTGLATSTQVAATVPLPTSLAGTLVHVKDSANVERVASLFFVSAGQINYQIPPGTAAGTATVTVTSGDGGLSSGTMLIAPISPGLFSAASSGQGVAAGLALRVKGDGTQSFEEIARFDTGQNKFVSIPIDLGPSTDQVFLILFGTGIRSRSALSAVTAGVGGTGSEVLFAGPQGGFVGLDQVNVRLARSLIGRGEVDVALSVDGAAANTVRINIR
jgi:uncharacterized protein (TIGR03437 family)